MDVQKRIKTGVHTMKFDELQYRLSRSVYLNYLIKPI